MNKTRHSWSWKGAAAFGKSKAQVCRICGMYRHKSGMNVNYYSQDMMRTRNYGCLEQFSRFTTNCSNFVPIIAQSTNINEAIKWVEESFTGKWNLRMFISNQKRHFEFRFEDYGEAGVFRMCGF